MSVLALQEPLAFSPLPALQQAPVSSWEHLGDQTGHNWPCCLQRGCSGSDRSIQVTVRALRGVQLFLIPHFYRGNRLSCFLFSSSLCGWCSAVNPLPFAVHQPTKIKIRHCYSNETLMSVPGEDKLIANQ